MYENYLRCCKKLGEENVTIDRTDNNGNYCKENCCWVNDSDNNNNRRNNFLITFNNEILTIPQWAKKLNINKATLFSRIKNSGWSIEKSFITPIRFRKKI